MQQVQGKAVFFSVQEVAHKPEPPKSRKPVGGVSMFGGMDPTALLKKKKPAVDQGEEEEKKEEEKKVEEKAEEKKETVTPAKEEKPKSGSYTEVDCRVFTYFRVFTCLRQSTLSSSHSTLST